MKVTLSHISLLAFFSEYALALPMIEAEVPYCYGYGSVYGAPDKLMKDDMDRVVEIEVG